MSSVAEQILSRVAAALVTANVASGRIERGREDAWGDDELPAINIARTAVESQALANKLEQHLLVFELQHLALGVTWETVADALHMASHAVLAADTQLAALGRGLRCVGTEALGASAEFSVARLIARYQIQFLTRPSDLTRAIN